MPPFLSVIHRTRIVLACGLPALADENQVTVAVTHEDEDTILLMLLDRTAWVVPRSIQAVEARSVSHITTSTRVMSGTLALGRVWHVSFTPWSRASRMPRQA